MTHYPTPVVLWSGLCGLRLVYRGFVGHNISRGRITVQEDLQRVLVLQKVYQRRGPS